MKTIIVIVLIVSACINCHHTSNSSKIATGCIFICVFTDSVLQFPLGVCIEMAEVAIGCIALRFFVFYIVARPVNVCINFNRVGLASGRVSLLYCYCI